MKKGYHYPIYNKSVLPFNQNRCSTSEKYYVYQLRHEDEELPFYIGKGSKDRSLQHEREAKTWDGISSHFSNGTKINKHKLWKIKKAIRSNKKIIIECIVKNLNENDAFLWEIYFIAAYGRHDRGIGNLTNHSDGGDGSHGRPNTPENRKQIENSIKLASDARKRSVVKISPEDGKIIDIYESTSSAAREHGLSGNSAICSAIKESAISCGFYWKYSDDLYIIDGYYTKINDLVDITNKHTHRHKEVIKFDIYGNIIEIKKSLKLFADELNVQPNTLSRYMNKKYPKRYSRPFIDGFYYRFAYDDNIVDNKLML